MTLPLRETQQPLRWTPVIPSETAQPVLAVIHAIADELRDPDRLPPAHETAGVRELNALVGGDASLASGHAGLALLFAQLFRHTHSSDDLATAVEHLNRALELAGSLPHLGLCSGIAGVAFAATQVGRLLPEETDSPVEIVDDLIAEAASNKDWTGNYDLIGGLVGLGICCLERRPRPAASKALALIVNALEDMAEVQPDGVAWRTPANLVPQHQLQLAPDGYFNTGAAHGIPAALAFLAAANSLGAGTQRTATLVADGVSWLLAQRLNECERSLFPSWVPVGDHPPTPSRVAWCYGDAGVAAMLLSTARSTGRSDWADVAIDIGRRAASLSVEACGVRDAGLCHGAAGLVHVFQFLHSHSGDPVLAKSARFWIDHIFSLSSEHTGVRAFPTETLNESGEFELVTDRGLLGGAAGVALTLLAAVSDSEPHWNRQLIIAAHPDDQGGAR